MTTPIHLRHKIGRGISPGRFMEGMKSRGMKLSSILNTQEQFRQVYDRFQWGARPAYIQNVMDEFKRKHADQQAGSYQEQWDQVYTRIGELYHKGNEYRKVMLQELKERFTSFA